MYPISDNVRQDLVTLIPASLFNEISCFVFYDYHPRDNKNIDIVVCTTRGEVKEFYKRDCVYSIVLETSSKPVEIKILRNTKCDQFYLVATENEVIVLSRREKLRVIHHIDNVDSYEIEDSLCRGKACLKIIRKYDAVPLVFDDDFVNLGLRAEILNTLSADDTSPVMTHLATKLTQAKFDVKNNEKTHKDLMMLRQTTAYCYYQKVSPNSAKAVFNEIKDSNVGLAMKNQKPWVRICNKNLVAIFELLNKDKVPIEDVYILLHNSTSSSMVYVTKLFKQIPTSPFWKEINSNKINEGCSTAVVLVIDMKELKYNVCRGIELSGVVAYKTQGKEQFLCIENICLSASDVMGECFDVLSTIHIADEDNYNILSLLATTEKTDFLLRHIKRENDPQVNLLDLFCEHLHMERISDAHNIIVHKQSPYHSLHGVLILQDSEANEANKWKISLHTRSPPQILAFIHYLHDAVPYRLLATTTTQIITSKGDLLSTYDEDPTSTFIQMNYMGLQTSILNQTAILLEYLDDCMVKMNDSRNPVVLSKIGTEIDVFAGGKFSYIEFRKKLLQEAFKGIKDAEDQSTGTERQGMAIDLD